MGYCMRYPTDPDGNRRFGFSSVSMDDPSGSPETPGCWTSYKDLA